MALPNKILPTQAALGAYRHEKSLFTGLAIISILLWVVLTGVTIGAVWIYLGLFALFGIAAHSALIAHLRGNAVRIDATQFADLATRLEYCCQRVGLATIPEAYLMSGNGLLNAFATRFLRRNFVVLYSDVVDALEDDPEAINFYIGHELGHIVRKHLSGWWLAPAQFLPILGAAYRRAQEYTCDQFGAACCQQKVSAFNALAVLAAGRQRWKQLSSTAFMAQCAQTNGFWMSFNELMSEYPWLCKRMARIDNPEASLPKRHFGAWCCAVFLPNGGPGGLLASLMIWFFVLGMLAAIALPQYALWSQKTKYVPIFAYVQMIQQKATELGQKTARLPQSIDELNLPAQAGVEAVTLEKYGEGDDESQSIEILLSADDVITLHGLWVSDEQDKAQLEWTCVTTLSQSVIPREMDCMGKPK